MAEGDKGSADGVAGVWSGSCAVNSVAKIKMTACGALVGFCGNRSTKEGYCVQTRGIVWKGKIFLSLSSC